MNDYREYANYCDEIYHHGVKGQKWGERRYQNPDGSLTPEGREHYGVKYSPLTGSTNLIGPNGKKVGYFNRRRIEKNMAKELKANRDKDPEAYANYRIAKNQANSGYYAVGDVSMATAYAAAASQASAAQGKMAFNKMLADYANAHLDDFDEKGRMRKK